MIGRLAVCVTCALLTVWAASEARAQADPGVTVRMLPSPDIFSEHGYMTFRFQVENKTSQSKRVQVELRGPDWGALASVKRTIDVSANSILTFEMGAPNVDFYPDGYVYYSVDGQSQRPIETRMRYGSGGRPSHSYWHGAPISTAAVLTTLQFSTRDLQAALANVDETNVIRIGARSDNVVFGNSDMELYDWPASWLFLSAYAGVVVSANEMSTAPDAISEVLRKYVELGGALVVIGTWQPPPEWRISQRTLLTGGTGHFRPPSDFNESESSEVDTGQATLTYMGWGTIAVLPEIEGALLAQVASEIRLTRDSLMRPPSDIIPPPPVPILWLGILIFTFAVLIGPVNVWVLLWWKRQTLLFVTMPVLSIVFAALIFVVTLASEGVTTKYRSMTITILDQQSRRASTIGDVGYYSPMAQGNGVTLDYETEFTPSRDVGYWGGGLGSGPSRARLGVSWTDSQVLDSAWLGTRVASNFSIRRSSIERSRLEFQVIGDETVEVTNLFPVSIRLLYFMDAQGRLYKSEAIPAGGKAIMQLAAEDLRGFRPARTALPAHREIFSRSWARQLETHASLPGHLAHFVQPNQYAALLDRSFLIDSGLPSVVQLPGDSLVIGLLEEAAQ